MTLEELKNKFFGDGSSAEDTEFYEWALLKRDLNKRENFPRPKKRQVWWCVIGKNIGHEQSCSEGFERPVLIVKVFGSTFWGLPITSSNPLGKKDNHHLYYKLEETAYSNDSGETKNLHGYVALNQLRVYDNRRLQRRITKMDLLQFNSIMSNFKKLL